MTSISSDILFSTLESEIDRAREGLKEVDDNIKRLTGRVFEPPQQRNDRQIRLSQNGRNDESLPKRRPSGGVFARLGAPVLESSSNESRNRRVLEVSSDDFEPVKKKPLISSSVARPVGDGRSRTEVAAELTKDRASRDRNRRMFGALLGTLQRFRSDEAKQKDKEDKRTKIEKKLEAKGRAEQEEMRKERIDLFKKREEQQARIRRLHFKMARIREHEEWEVHQRKLARFIRTSATPKIFWLPKIQNVKSSHLVTLTKEVIEDELKMEHQKLKGELEEILGGSLDHGGSDSDGEDAEEGELRTHRPASKRRNSPKRSPLTKRRSSQMDLNNSELLDYEAEEGELVYDDNEQVFPGKVKPKPERVVVQVKMKDSEASDARVSGRRVELVSVVAGSGERKVTEEKSNSRRVTDVRNAGRRVEECVPTKELEYESNSEKENFLRKSEVVSKREEEKIRNEKKVTKEKREKDKGEKSHKKKEKDRPKEKQREERNKPYEPVNKKPKIIHESNDLEVKSKIQTNDSTNETKLTSKVIETTYAQAPIEKKGETEDVWSEDLSHILLPLEPQPVLEMQVDDSRSSLSKTNVEMKDPPDANSNEKMEVSEVTEETKIVEDSDTKVQKLKQREMDLDSDQYPNKPGKDENSQLKSKSESESSSDSEESSSDSESSITNTSESSSDLSESESSSSTFSSDSEGSEEEDEQPRPSLKRRRCTKKRSPSSSVDSSSDSEGESRKRMRPKHLSKRMRHSPSRNKEDKQSSISKQRSAHKDKRPVDKKKEDKKEKDKEEKESVKSREREKQQKEKTERSSKSSSEKKKEESKGRERRGKEKR